MTAHVHLVQREADEGEATEHAPVGLPGETLSPLAGLPGENPPPLVLSPEDRAAGDDMRGALSRARFEALLRGLLPHRRARAATEAGERRADEAESVGAAAANEGGADAAIEALSTSDGAGSADVAPEDPRAAPQSTKGLAKPLWKRPIVIGGAAAVLAASLPAIVLFSSPSPPRPVVAEPGMEAQPHRELMAPAAALATVPKREAAAESPAKPVAPGERSDQLREILALHVEPKTAAQGDGKNGAGALEPAKPAQEAAPPAKIAAPVSSATTPTEARKAEAVAPGKEVGEPGPKPEAAVKIAAPVVVDPSIAVRREAAEAAARRAAVKEQTQVLEKVTQLGALVTHLSEQVNELQAKVKTLSDGSEEKFADLGRRIALGEAGRSLNAATAAQTAPPPSGASTLALPRDAAEPGAPPPAKIVRAAAKAVPAEAETPRRYRIQAASPGLAMLAAIGGGVEDDAPLQVAVGAKIPGYGRITRIEQRGAAWVVETDRGSIQ